MLASVWVERLAAATLAIAVVLFAFGSSDVASLRSVGSDGRWLALVAADFVVWLLVWRERGAPLGRSERRMLSSAAALVALAYLSATWSVDARLTIERATTLLLLAGLAAGVAHVAQRRRGFAPRVVGGVVSGVAVVVFSGLLLAAVSPSDAIQADPTRFRGIGENPNTVPLLVGLAFPLGLWLVARQPGLVGRILGAGAILVVYGTLAASGSRGAMLAALAGVATALFLGRGGIAAPAAAVAALAGAGLVLMLVAPAAQRRYLATRGTPVTPVAAQPVPGGNSAAARPRLEDELGAPGNSAAARPRLEDELGAPGNSAAARPRLEDELSAPGGSAVPGQRSFFSSSGRIQAWHGAIDQGLERPLTGYGFGTEDRVFVDRYYWFQGSRPENSLIGIFLQLGVVGLLALVALVVLAMSPAVWFRVRRGALDPLAGATAAVVVGGVVTMFFQSYAYSVGNIGALTFWLAAFLTGSAVLVRPETVAA